MKLRIRNVVAVGALTSGLIAGGALVANAATAATTTTSTAGTGAPSSRVARPRRFQRFDRFDEHDTLHGVEQELSQHGIWFESVEHAGPRIGLSRSGTGGRDAFACTVES